MTTFTDIQKFLASMSKMPADKIVPGTRLYHDLKIDGDDFMELLLQFSKQFHVPLEGHDFKSFYGSEIGAGIRHWIFLLSGHRWPSFKPFTAQMLLDAASKGNFK